MLIRLQVEGGFAVFPGLASPSTLDTTSLPAAEAAELEALVQAARFFELPARVGGAAGAADFRTYVVSVEHAGRIHTVTAIEPIGDPSLQALIETVRARQRRPV